MHEGGHAKTGVGAAFVLTAIGVISVAMATWCWLHVSGLTTSDAFYLGLKSFEMGESYDHVRKLPPREAEPWVITGLDIARWLGAIVKLSAFALIAYAFAGQYFVRAFAGMCRSHIIVVGDTPLARAMVERSKAHVIHLHHGVDAPQRKGRLIRLPFSDHALQQASAGHASRIVFAMEDQNAALELAIAAAQTWRQAQVDVQVSDPWLANRIHCLPGAETVRAFSEPEIAARDVIRRYPPFLLARDQTQQRLHAVLVGDDDWCETLMAEIILSAGTLVFGTPVITILCRDPAAFEARLTRRYPEIGKAADLMVAGYGADAASPETDLSAIGGRAPITAVYVAMEDRSHVLSAALALSEAARKSADFTAPFLVLNGSATALTRPAPGSRLEAFALVPFGLREDMARATGLMAHEADVAEKAYHAAYLQFAPQDGDAGKPWDQLREEYRVSNRRAVAHIYAKLFEAGFDLRPWMAVHDVWSELPALAPDEKLWRDDAEYERLAELEHERWIADRRLSGWSYGTPRDNERRLHPDIVPFARLSKTIQDYDRKFIDLLAKVLKTAPDGLRRPA